MKSEVAREVTSLPAQFCALCAEDKKIYLRYHKTYTSEQTPQLTGVLREATVPVYYVSPRFSIKRELVFLKMFRGF